MKRFLWLITGPIALVIIAFAVANRQKVVLSFDPFSLDAPALALEMPLWMVAFLAFVGGLIVGGALAFAGRTGAELKRAARKRQEIKSANVPDPLAGVPAIASGPQAPSTMLHPPAALLTRRV